MQALEFWVSVGSTYSYLTVSRIGRLAAGTGVPLDWRVFSVRAIMMEMDNIPFANKPVKAAYMWRDIERRAARYGFQVAVPAPYPLEHLALANQVALVGAREGWAPEYVVETYRLWFQDGQPSAIFVIFITSIWPIIINTSIGIRNIPEDYRNVARVIRLNGIEYFIKIMLPAAAPFIFSGLRIGVGLSWLAIIAAEMLIGGVGIGFFIWDAWNSSRISDIILALIYVGLIGFILDRVVAWIGRIVTRGTSAS